VLLSPGPKAPDQAGICLPLLRGAPDDLPILGVCLGHQAIGQAYGGEVIRAKEVMHGKTSKIRHNDKGIFKGLPNPFTATRYHSLAFVAKTCPPNWKSPPGPMTARSWACSTRPVRSTACSSTPNRSPPRAATRCWPTSWTWPGVKRDAAIWV
jgi:anthranilate synthase component 2